MIVFDTKSAFSHKCNKFFPTWITIPISSEAKEQKASRVGACKSYRQV